jgi:hypothetical protein
VAVLDEVGAERTHGGVLVGVVAERDDDVDGQTRGASGERQALPVVAGGRRDDAGGVRASAQQPIDEHQPAANLERADRQVVLVLDPDVRAEVFGEQRPTVGRSGWQRAVHERGSLVEFGAGE